MASPTSPALLPQILAFDPDWIKDPVPWVLRYLDKEAAIGAALIRVEFQRTVHTAHAKALEQLQGVLQKELQRK
jgi:hypothetical protein